MSTFEESEARVRAFAERQVAHGKAEGSSLPPSPTRRDVILAAIRRDRAGAEFEKTLDAYVASLKPSWQTYKKCYPHLLREIRGCRRPGRNSAEPVEPGCEELCRKIRTGEIRDVTLQDVAVLSRTIGALDGRNDRHLRRLCRGMVSSDGYFDLAESMCLAGPEILKALWRRKYKTKQDLWDDIVATLGKDADLVADEPEGDSFYGNESFLDMMLHRALMIHYGGDARVKGDPDLDPDAEDDESDTSVDDNATNQDDEE